MLAVQEYEIEEAIVFTNDNVKVKGKITYLPIYMVMFLQKDVEEFVDISLDKYQF